MPRDDRLKKRTAVPQSNKIDVYDDSGVESGNSFSGTGGQRISASSGRARNRRRYKGSMTRNRVSIRCLKRNVRNLALRIGTKKRGRIPTNLKTATFLLCLFVVSFVVFKNPSDGSNTRKLRKKVKWRLPAEFNISFPTTESRHVYEAFFQIDAIKTVSEGDTDYGGLELGGLDGRQRQISDSDYLSESGFRDPYQSRDDDGNDAYLAFDDDFLRGTTGTMNENPTNRVCHRISDHRVSFQNCNSIYELDWLSNHVKYLNAGSYRQVFSLEHSFLQQRESIAVKDMYQSNDFASGDYEFMRMDAMVAERLTASPRIYDIYGFCGLSILSEFFPHGDMEGVAVDHDTGYLLTSEDQQDYLEDLESYNNLSNEQKLVISLQMAEGLADLHGAASGVIVHQDVQLGQFLYNSDKSLVKLNDFNRAEFMLYDVEAKEYCKYGEGHGAGNWRSPEEYFDYDLDEQVDVFALGNNMYSLLTGLCPFYDEDKTKVAQARVKSGVKPFIDPRYLKEKSLAEAKLAEIIDRCYAYKPEDRPSIFEVVEFLRDALKQFREQQPTSDAEDSADQVQQQ